MRWTLLSGIGLGLVGCARLACGPGTEEVDGECVAIEATPPMPPSIECGPGTIEVDGVCEIEAPTRCGPGTILVGDECVGVDGIRIATPFAADTPVAISQGFHGNFSHNGYGTYALDFPAPVGTEITAARSGLVVRVREDSDEGCPEPACADLANFVVIDHGDGTVAQYLHLAFQGALVEPGDGVQAGDPIGLVGNTGFSSGPHLHLQVDNLLGHSLPLIVDELDGIAYHGARWVSENDGTDAEPVPTAYSDCRADTWGFLGITVDAGTPCVVADLDTPLTLSGMAGTPGDVSDTVEIWQFSRVENQWQTTCVATNGDGSFETTIEWAAVDHLDYGFFSVAAADSNCNTLGSWFSSPRVDLR
ncbi:MAG: M23 family metallopeptidase, partial [Myxococcota bacterium]